MHGLTPRQTEVLAFIRSYLQETGYPPTRADIARQLGFRSPNAAEEHLKALARKGAIEIIPGTSRGIRLPDAPGLPIVGRVAAGSPVLAEAHLEGHCALPESFFQPRADFLLRVQGMSMRDAGILEGDLLAVHRTHEVRNGQIVVARVDDEVTVKRLQRDGRSRHQLTLLPENPDFAPIRVDLRRHDVTIEGRGVGVIRQQV